MLNRQTVLYILCFLTWKTNTTIDNYGKIRGRSLMLEAEKHMETNLVFLPYKTELTEVANELQDFKLCKFAMMALFLARLAWVPAG
jgi:hypothetical protein